MHDLEAVAFVKDGVRPLTSRHNIAVELDSDAVGLHPKHLYQNRQRERGGWALKIATFTVDREFHRRGKVCVAARYSALRKTNFRVAVRPS